MTESALAVLGAAPAFQVRLHVNRPSLGDREGFLSRVEGMLDTRWFSNGGPYVEELERQIARQVGVKHCVLVCNGTAALQLTVRAMGLTGEILVPSFTFVATAHALAWVGLEPVFCDIDSESWNLDPEACEAAVSPATSAILGVHLFGRPCDTDELGAVARRHGLQVLFDAAHGFGCTHKGRAIGTHGIAEIFSFHATKVFHTFEGGAVVTNRDELASRVRRLRNFGFRGVDDVATLGINAKMPEVCAAMGLSNLERYEHLVAASQATFDVYRSGLVGIPGLRLRGYDVGERHNWQYIVLEVDEEELGLTRDALVRVLEAENVLARRYFFPGCHAMEPYLSKDPLAGEHLPVTIQAGSRVLILPGGPDLSREHAERLCSILRSAASRAGEVRIALGAEADRFSALRAVDV